MFKQILVIALLTLTFTVNASDLAKEKRWADQVVDAIIDGDAVWINDGSREFLGIYTEAETDKNRAVIIMHGTGVHPDWQQVIQPLRVGLPVPASGSRVCSSHAGSNQHVVVE